MSIYTTSEKQDNIRQVKQDLEDVRQALIDIQEGGQSVSIGDMTYTEVNYNALRERETELRRRLARLQGTRPLATGVNFGGLGR